MDAAYSCTSSFSSIVVIAQYLHVIFIVVTLASSAKKEKILPNKNFIATYPEKTCDIT